MGEDENNLSVEPAAKTPSEKQIAPDFGEVTYDQESTAAFRQKTIIADSPRFSLWRTQEGKLVLRKDMTPFLQPDTSSEQFKSYRGEEMAAEMIRALGGKAPLTRVAIEENPPQAVVWIEYFEKGVDVGFGAVPEIKKHISPDEFARTLILKGLLDLRGDSGQLLLVSDQLYLYDSFITPEMLNRLTTNPELVLAEFVYETQSVLAGTGLMVDYFFKALTAEGWKAIEFYFDTLASQIDKEEIAKTLSKYGSNQEEITGIRLSLHNRLDALRQITDFLTHYNEQTAELRAAFLGKVITAIKVRIFNLKTGKPQDLTSWADVESSRQTIQENFQKWKKIKIRRV